MKHYLLLSFVFCLFFSASAVSGKMSSSSPFDVSSSNESASPEATLSNQYIYAKTNLMGEDRNLQFAGMGWKVEATIPVVEDGKEGIYGFNVGNYWEGKGEKVGLIVRFDKKYLQNGMIKADSLGIAFFESKVTFPFSGELMLYKNGDKYFKISLSPIE